MNWTLYALMPDDYGVRWFLRRVPGAQAESFPAIPTEMGEVDAISASPNGKYLAVISAGEGHPAGDKNPHIRRG